MPAAAATSSMLMALKPRSPKRAKAACRTRSRASVLGRRLIDLYHPHGQYNRGRAFCQDGRVTPRFACDLLWLAWAVYWAWAARRAAPPESGETRAQRAAHLLPTAAAAGLLFWPLPPGLLGLGW